MLMLAVLGMNAQVESLYIIGNDPFGDWNPSVGMQMDFDGEYFSLTVEVPSSVWFSFTQQLASDANAWDEISSYRMAALSNNFAITEDLNGEVIQCSEWGKNVNNAFMTTMKATYTILVDPVNCQMMMTWEGGEKDPDPEPDGNIYILGMVNGKSWAPNDGVKMDKESETLFTAVVTIADSSATFNFTRALATNPNNWGGIAPYRFGSVEGTVYLMDVLGEPQELGAEGDTENNFSLDPGTYKLTLDMEARTLVAEVTDAPEPETGIFLVGSLNNWAPLDGIAMATEDNNIYTYTATLNGEVYFIFTNAKADWADINNGEHRYGPAAGDEEITVGQEVTTQLTGDTGAYKLVLGEETEVTITFDLANLKFKVEDNKGLVGDVNGDNAVDGNDLNMLINIILGKEVANDAANVDGEGGVDGNDLNALINILLGK